MKQHFFKNRKGTQLVFFFAKRKRREWGCFCKYVVFFLTCFLFFSKNTIAQCTLGCNGSINIALNANGEYQVTPMTLLSNPFCNVNDFSISLEDMDGNPIDSLLNCDIAGKTLIGTVTDLSNNNSCSGSINVFDNLAPSIQCQDVYLFCYEDASPDSIGIPNIVDNCTMLENISLSHSDVFTDLPCFTMQGGFEITAKIERFWTAKDAFENTTTCIQNIYYKRVTSADVIFPDNKDDFESPALDCNENPTDLTIAGQPTIGGVPITSGSICELAISYTDQTFDICGNGGYKIIRTWTAVDWCSSDFILDAQVINIMDTTAPNINCPSDLIVGTNNNCGGIVIFPNASATDNCSEYNISLNWQFGIGLGPFNDIPQGVYVAEYIATDDCGNADTCQIQVTVEDDDAPIAICEGNLNINLTNDGIATIPTTAFDAGSFDNCQLDFIEVSRDGINFGNSVTLGCNDLNNNVEITVRAHDVAGNVNECLTMVSVNDNIPPIIICPLSKTVGCTDDLNDLNITGEAIAEENCNLDTIYFDDVFNLNTCNEGTITRTWTAVDLAGNESSCNQTLIVEDNSPLQISYPNDIDLYGCNSSTSSTVTGEPILVNDDCESVGVSSNDVVFANESGLCVKILRTWTVVDWCVYQPNSGNNNGYYTFVQVIKVIDNGSTDSYSVAGVVNLVNGNLLNNASINLIGNTIDTSTLITDGIYDFSEIQMDSSVIVSPFRDGDDANGVNTIDMVLIRKHILGLAPFDTPYKFIAGDVNNSGTVTTFDLVIIRQVILQLIPEFSGESWIFLDADYVFTNPNNPLSENYPTAVSFFPQTGEEYDFDFIAIKRGDVNGNASGN